MLVGDDAGGVGEQLLRGAEVRDRRAPAHDLARGRKRSRIDPHAGPRRVRIVTAHVVRVRAHVVDTDALRDDAQPRHEPEPRVLRLRVEVLAKATERVGAEARHHGDDDVAAIVLVLPEPAEEPRLRDEARERCFDRGPQRVPRRVVGRGRGSDQAFDLVVTGHRFLFLLRPRTAARGETSRARRWQDADQMPTFVIGDPQAPFAKVLEVLDRHGALAPGKDRLADGVVLVSIGDHFDYDLEHPAEAAAEGLRTLRWLASHDREQVILLFGNHDAARVMELAYLDDETFQAARAFGREIDHVAKTVGPKAAKDREREFAATYPALPSSGVIGRDCASFTTEQRALVIDLLLAGRFSLARTAVLADGRAALLTHAGITNRELEMLDIGYASEPDLIAKALSRFFAEAIDRVRPAWEAGELAALSLAPLHVTGSHGEEGGGLLYHRPTNPASSKIDMRWAASSERPRRFDPRELPTGVTQVVGHTGHAKCTFELAAWATDAARARKRGGIRTLRVTGKSVVYDVDVLPPSPSATDMIFIDGELRRLPAHEVALLRVDRIT